MVFCIILDFFFCQLQAKYHSRDCYTKHLWFQDTSGSYDQPCTTGAAPRLTERTLAASQKTNNPLGNTCSMSPHLCDFYLQNFPLLSFENQSLSLSTRTLSSTERNGSVGHHHNLREKFHSCLLPSCSQHLSKPLLPATSQDLPMFKFSPCGTCQVVWDHFSLCKALQIMEKVDGEGTFRKTTVSEVFVPRVAWQGHLNWFWLDIEPGYLLLMHKVTRLEESIVPGHYDRNAVFFSPLKLPL